MASGLNFSPFSFISLIVGTGTSTLPDEAVVEPAQLAKHIMQLGLISTIKKCPSLEATAKAMILIAAEKVSLKPFFSTYLSEVGKHGPFPRDMDYMQANWPFSGKEEVFLDHSMLLDECFKVLLYLSNEMLHTLEFLPFMPSPPFWTPFHDYELLWTFKCEGFSEDGRILSTDTDRLMFVPSLEAYPSSEWNSNWLERRLRALITCIFSQSTSWLPESNAKILEPSEFVKKYQSCEGLMRPIPRYRQKQMVRGLWTMGVFVREDFKSQIDLRKTRTAFRMNMYHIEDFASVLNGILTRCRKYFANVPSVTQSGIHNMDWIPEPVFCQLGHRLVVYHAVRSMDSFSAMDELEPAFPGHERWLNSDFLRIVSTNGLCSPRLIISGLEHKQLSLTDKVLIRTEMMMLHPLDTNSKTEQSCRRDFCDADTLCDILESLIKLSEKRSMTVSQTQ